VVSFGHADARAAGLAAARRRPRLWSAFRSVPVILGVGVLLGYLVVTAIGPVISPHDPNALSGLPFAPPSRAHWFGTDDLGRDQFSRCISAVRIAVMVALGSVSLGLVVGTIIGVVAGYARGFVEVFLMRLMDVKFAFPDLIFALIIVAALGPGVWTAILAIAVVYIPRFARIARTATATVQQSLFIEAARLSGTHTPTIMLKHVLPNIAAPLIVMTAISVGTAQLAYATLAFLGFGAPRPQADFGSMLAVGRAYMTFDASLVIFPSICLVAFTIASCLVGDAVRDALDPRTRFVEG
jgi:ABC-type dipeptide/oligopeptide/nickel transport system permease subunit